MFHINKKERYYSFVWVWLRRLDAYALEVKTSTISCRLFFICCWLLSTSWVKCSRYSSVSLNYSSKRKIIFLKLLHPQVILTILAANAAVGVITETNAEKALEVTFGFIVILNSHNTRKPLDWLLTQLVLSLCFSFSFVRVSFAANFEI